MSILVPFNGVNYIIPTPGETGWGSNLDSFFVAIGAGALQKIGGNFFLASEVDFGPSFGLKSLYYKAGAGTVGAPSFTFASETNTGLYLPQAHTLSLVTSGVDRVIVGNSIVNFLLPIGQQGGTQSTPQYTWSNDLTTGLWHSAIGEVAVTTAGTTKFIFSTAANTSTLPVLLPNGSLSAPSLAASADTNTGLVWNSADNVSLISGGGGFAGGEVNVTSNGISVNSNAQFALGINGGINNDYICQIANSSLGTSAVSVMSATTGRATALLAAFNPNYVGTRCGQPAADMANIEFGGTNLATAAIVTQTAAPLYFGTNQTAAAHIDTSQVWTFNHGPIFIDLTASTVPYLDSSKKLTSSTVAPTELGYVSGVTSSIQTQLNGKATDSLVVHLAGTETITGSKNFTVPVALATSGTNTAPQLSLGQANTGLFTGAAGQFAATANGTTAMSWTSSAILAVIQLALEPATNQLLFDHGGTGNITITAPAAAANRIYTIPDSGLNSTFLMSGWGQIVNADISASAAIAYSKLTLTNSIVNADVNTAAAIAYSKLNLSASIVNADIATAAAIVRSKLASTETTDVTYASGKGIFWTDSGTNTVKLTAPTTITSTYTLKWPVAQGGSNQYLTNDGSGNLSWTNAAGTGTVNSGTQFQLAYYATSTNAVSGLTLITASRALASDANGLPVAATTTTTELNFVSGVTSAIQTQINTKAPTASPTFTGVATFANGTAGAPSVTLGDSTTGLYRDAANHISVSLAGNQAAQFFQTGSSNATQYNLLYLLGGGGSGNALEVVTQRTTGVSGATSILGAIDINSYIGLVYGFDGSNNDFTDIIHFSYYSASGSPQVISSMIARGSPAARTYTHGADGTISLAMASGTYTIRITALGLGT